MKRGTDADLYDIESGIEADEIYVSGYSFGKSVLIKIKNHLAETVWEGEVLTVPLPYEGIIYGIYSNNKDLFVASRIGLFREKLFNGTSVSKIAGTTNWYPYGLTGEVITIYLPYVINQKYIIITA